LRVLIVHALYDTLGGGEHLSLRLADILRNAGHDVTVLTSTELDRDVVRMIFGIDISRLRIVVKRVGLAEALKCVSRGRLVRLRRLMVYRRLFKEFVEPYRDEYDVVIETQSNIVAPADISYIHYPALALYRSGDPAKRGIHWRVYNWLVRRYIDTRFRNAKAGRVVTNSRWTAGLIYRLYGVVADVVHPPVDVETFSRVASNDVREKLVVTVSRFTPEKNLMAILDVAERMRDHTFVIAGTVDRYTAGYYSAIAEEARRRRLDNVVLEPNCPRHRLLSYLEHAMIYLHPPYAEHFGISVVEAMAAGAVPLVYRDGGAWTDIVSPLSPMLGYRSIEEVPSIIRRLESDQRLYRELRARGIEHAKRFSTEVFGRRMLELISYVAEVKQLSRAVGRV